MDGKTDVAKEDMETDAEPGGGGTPASRGGGDERFDYDVALLFSRQCGEEEDLADQLLSEMQSVELQHRRLRVVHYSDHTFGASIIERPGNVLRRCRFVFVLITENTQTDKETRYAKNETLGRILDAEKADRRHCVRPLLLQRGVHGSLPAGLADVDEIYWVEGEKEKCAARLATLLQHSIDNDNQASKKEPSDGPSAQEEKRKDNTTDISFKGKESGTEYRVNIQGTVNNLMVGEHQHMVVNMPATHKTGGTKSKKKNKHPVTECNELPSREAMETVAGEVGSRWRKLGRRLGLSDGEIETVQLNHQGEGQEEVVYQMVRKWMVSASPPASLSLLAHACVQVGCGDIADKLSLLQKREGDKT